MKSEIASSLALAITLFSGSVILAEESNTEDWINKHAAIKTTESVERDGNGDIRSIKKIKETVVYVRQTSTEIQKPDKNGNMSTVSRLTSTLDTLGGSATITETQLPGSSTLVTTAITTVEKTPGGMLTTVYARDKTGKISIVSRTTALIQNNAQPPQIVL